MLSETRDTNAAKTFFANALYHNGIPKRITIDKSRSNGAGIKEINKTLKRLGTTVKVDTVRSKYLDNMIGHDHRFIKRVTRPMLGFKSFASTAATLAGIEVAHMIRKSQLGTLKCGFRPIVPVRRWLSFAPAAKVRNDGRIAAYAGPGQWLVWAQPE